MTAPVSTPAQHQHVVPLDPNSAKGREVAERFGNILAEIEREIAQQEMADRGLGRAA